MDKDLIIFFIATFLLIVSVLFGANYLSEISCNSKWKYSNFNVKYEFTSGCLIEVSKNKWIPEKNYREFAK